MPSLPILDSIVGAEAIPLAKASSPHLSGLYRRGGNLPNPPLSAGSPSLAALTGGLRGTRRCEDG